MLGLYDMLTVFSIPKAFTGHIATIQRNAIQSWLRLEPGCEVMLCGNDPGVAEICRELDLPHLDGVACNEYGTPLLSSAFDQVQARARNDLICYVNADIILLPDLIARLRNIPFERFLLVGTRWNVDIAEPLDFDGDWSTRLRQQVQARGAMQPPAGSDHFTFVKHTLGSLPPFAVGRPGWDNWMIYHGRRLGMPVIDSSPSLMVVHQNHDYGHIKQRYDGQSYAGPEADHNLGLLEDYRQRFILLDATHLLAGDKVVRAVTVKHLVQRVKTFDVLHPEFAPVFSAARQAARLFK